MNIWTVVFFSALLFFQCHCKVTQGQQKYLYWSNLTGDEKKSILNQEKVSKEAREYFEGKLEINDDSRFRKLLDTLTSVKVNDERIAAFYFFLFNQIVEKADGSVSEGLGRYCQTIILNNPEYVFSYFLKQKTMMIRYAKYLGYELYFKKENTSMITYNYNEFQKLLIGKIGGRKHFDNLLPVFFLEIETAMKSMD